ncbi:MAG: DUF3768 domain-containing protein [Hafnia sp.]
MPNLTPLQIKNDEFRRNLIANYQKQDKVPSVFLAPGVVALYDSDPKAFYSVLDAVINFPEEKFTDENDPHKEHDMAFFDVEGERYFFKIDYYDVNFEFHCGEENMLNDELCRRVLTIAHSSEY